MKNFDSPGDRVQINVAATVAANNPPKSGDPVVAGRLAGIAAFDFVSGDKGVVVVKGVYKVPVSSVHNGISIGETVFIDPAAGTLSDDFNDVPFGTALDAVNAAATATIRVRLFGATPGETGANS